VDPIDLCFAGAAQQAQLIRDGEVSARELIDATLRRIDELNPRLNAYRVVFAEQAIEQAAGIDARPRDERALALLGVPVAIKDDTDVAGELTAWGTSAPGQAKPNDADVVARLRSAGAIIIGKTHVSEMTAWPWTSSKAWGVTRNPWDPDRTPGGSSGGSATATAAGMCGVALGSDGGGSVRYPAALTGLFGLKPQRDRIPLGVQHADGWHGLLTYGSLSRTVADAALFLDAAANPTPSGQFADGLHLPIGALRVAVSFDPPAGSMVRLTAERRLAVERVAKVLDELGHHVIEREIRYTARAMRNTTIRYLAGVHQDVATMAHPDQLERNTRRVARLGSMVPSWLLARSRPPRRGGPRVGHQPDLRSRRRRAHPDHRRPAPTRRRRWPRRGRALPASIQQRRVGHAVERDRSTSSRRALRVRHRRPARGCPVVWTPRR